MTQFTIKTMQNHRNKKILNINSDQIVPSQQWKRYKKKKNKIDITSLDLIYDYSDKIDEYKRWARNHYDSVR